MVAIFPYEAGNAASQQAAKDAASLCQLLPTETDNTFLRVDAQGNVMPESVGRLCQRLIVAERAACKKEASKYAEGLGKQLDENGVCVSTIETRRVARDIAQLISARTATAAELLEEMK